MNLAVFNGYADGAIEIAAEKADLWLGEGCLFGTPSSRPRSSLNIFFKFNYG
jgi:hypothetical protein